MFHARSTPKIGIWQSIAVDWDALVDNINDFVARADSMSPDDVRARLKELVPEYRPEGGQRRPPRTQETPSVSTVRAAANGNSQVAPDVSSAVASEATSRVRLDAPIEP